MKNINDYRTNSAEYGVKCETEEEWKAIVELVAPNRYTKGIDGDFYGNHNKIISIYADTSTTGWGYHFPKNILQASDFLQNTSKIFKIFN